MSKRYWVEITDELPHGGNGWEYKKFLWSPTKDVEDKEIYTNMTKANVGDVVIHFCKDNTGNIYIDGESEIDSKAIVVNTPPPVPGKWAGRPEYYKIKLKNFIKYTGNRRIKVDDFIKANNNLIKSEKKYINKFYPFNKNNILNQGKYLCEITYNIYRII